MASVVWALGAGRRQGCQTWGYKERGGYLRSCALLCSGGRTFSAFKFFLCGRSGREHHDSGWP